MAKKDLRNYVQDHPRHAASGQMERLGDGETYVEDRRGLQIDALIRSVRRGSIVQVDQLFLLAPVKGRPSKRKRLLAERLDAIKAAGGTVREASSGAESSKAGWNAAVVNAIEMISFGGRGAPGKTRVGRPPKYEFTAEQWEVIEGIWRSRRYANDAARLVAIEKRLGKVPGRTLLRNKLGSPHGGRKLSYEG